MVICGGGVGWEVLSLISALCPCPRGTENQSWTTGSAPAACVCDGQMGRGFLPLGKASWPHTCGKPLPSAPRTPRPRNSSRTGQPHLQTRSCVRAAYPTRGLWWSGRHSEPQSKALSRARSV